MLCVCVGGTQGFQNILFLFHLQWKFAVLEAVAPPHYFDGRNALLTIYCSFLEFTCSLFLEGDTLTFSQFLLDPSKGTFDVFDV